jgi:uncharacterized protein
MVKVPMAGLTKTRLARELGIATATRFSRHATLALLARMTAHAAWQTTLAVAPDSGVAWRGWPRGMVRIPQGRGDLGERMQRIMHLSARGPVVIIGSDIPGIRACHIRAAFRLLGQRDAVFGPATDGGYWLVGLRRFPRVLAPFDRVRWSSPHALGDTLGNMEGRSIAHVAVLADVDTADDYARSAAVVGRRVVGPHT